MTSYHVTLRTGGQPSVNYSGFQRVFYDRTEQYGKIFQIFRSSCLVNFCAVYGCSNRSNREKDRSYFRLPAIITRPNDEKQALTTESRVTWLARIRRDDLASNPSFLLLPRVTQGFAWAHCPLSCRHWSGKPPSNKLWQNAPQEKLLSFRDILFPKVLIWENSLNK